MPALKAKQYKPQARCTRCQGYFDTAELIYDTGGNGKCGKCYNNECLECGERMTSSLSGTKCKSCDAATAAQSSSPPFPIFSVVGDSKFTKRGNDTDPAHSEQTHVMTQLLKRVEELEKKNQNLETMEMEMAKMREELTKLTKTGTPKTGKFNSSEKCDWCKLDVSEHPYCGMSGRLHIREAEARHRLKETRARFPFPDSVLTFEAFYPLSPVIFLISFHDVIGAPDLVRRSATRWLARHFIRLLLPDLNPRKNYKSITLDAYDPGFSEWCTPKRKS
eukprot:TRINITY_DN26924_c0_g1_i1.p1 TRINITY_DN26924_c0_g1~~TRINITY_DN26924_c0_g1_i1.p1  ORF type:complete len:277 (+),score=36.17 TRINITY_DN26924_c0_g1_i1:62-892(+)